MSHSGPTRGHTMWPQKAPSCLFPVGLRPLKSTLEQGFLFSFNFRFTLCVCMRVAAFIRFNSLKILPVVMGIRGLSRNYPAMHCKKWRHLLKKIQDTRNIVHRTMMPQSPSKWTPWDFTQFSQSPSAALLYFPESHWVVLGKARSHRVPTLGCSGAESPMWFGVFPKNSAGDVMHEHMCCCDEAADHQLPIVAVFWVIRIVSMEECSSLMENLMQICCSTPSAILNAMATQYMCSLNDVCHHPHWLVQWSHHCSCTCPVHSLWLPGYMDVVQTVLVILTMAGLFLDQPYIYIKCYSAIKKRVKCCHLQQHGWT